MKRYETVGGIIIRRIEVVDGNSIGIGYPEKVLFGFLAHPFHLDAVWDLETGEALSVDHFPKKRWKEIGEFNIKDFNPNDFS